MVGVLVEVKYGNLIVRYALERLKTKLEYY